MHPRHLVFAVKFTAADGAPDIATFSTREKAVEAMKAQKGSTLHLHMVGEDVPVKLSEPQKRFLADFARRGYSVSPDGRIGASAWHRTAKTLEAMGLVKKTRYCVAQLTWKGLAYTVELDKSRTAR